MEKDQKLCYEFKEYVKTLGLKVPNSFKKAIRPILFEYSRYKQNYSR